ncbi:MAG: DUF1749 domain-containing protein [Candidatus Melainabacteria bacterium]|nr:DUF1749 domain-containing protein [Candidatus Melainabacteria bacterium]
MLLLIFLYIISISLVNAKATDTLIHVSNEILRNNNPVDLVFYFHGLGTHEGFILPPFIYGGLDIVEHKEVYRKDLIFIAFHISDENYGAGPEEINDIVKNIKIVASKFNTRKIYLIGASFGGSIVLNVLNYADKELRNKLVGALACFPVTDFEYTLAKTKRENISSYLNRYFDKYKSSKQNIIKYSSPINQTSMIKNDAEVILIEGIKDTHVPPPQIENYYKKLKLKLMNKKLIKVSTDHNFTDIAEIFQKEVISFLK